MSSDSPSPNVRARREKTRSEEIRIPANLNIKGDRNMHFDSVPEDTLLLEEKKDRERTKSYLSDGFKNSRPESVQSSNGITIGKPTLASEQRISETIQGNSPKRLESWRYGSSLSRSGQNSSLPKGSVARNRMSSRRQSAAIDSDSDRENLAEVLSEHLVRKPVNRGGHSFGSTAHSLMGGAITRDIYKLQEDSERGTKLNRSNSTPDLPSMARPQGTTSLLEPGGFRRNFITTQSRQQGRKEPNFLTRNFIDFLVLYGHYGGDVYPSDDESDQSEDGEFDELIIDNDENASLLRNRIPRTNSTTIAAVHHTSESKAFFMLLKAFVGTGVLFLPKAFVNGGLVFALIAMFVMAVLSTHCMIILTETSRHHGNKSFGELGKIIYGEECRLLVLGSIAVSQMVSGIHVGILLRILYLCGSKLKRFVNGCIGM